MAPSRGQDRAIRPLRERPLVSRPPRALALPALLAAAAFLSGGASRGAEEAAAAKAASPLTLEAVRVEPAAPAAETLCHLAVTLKNTGEKAASRLEFRVKVNGVELPAYRRLVHLARVPPGGTLDLPLFNFWSSETGRPAPADGKLAVEVTLASATWVEGASANGAETWKPAAPAGAPAKAAVPGLPAAKTLTLKLAGKGAPAPPKQR